MADPQIHPAGDPTKGVLLVMAATLMFALSDVMTKHLATLYPVSLVIEVRYIVNIALMMAILGPRQGRTLWRTNRTFVVVLRGLALCLGSLTMGLALRVMPVGETVAIVYLAPFAVMLLGAWLLGEKVSVIGWIGAVLGFLGVLLIARPGSGLDPLGVVLCLVNAGCATAYHLLTRVLARTETTNALLFNTALVGVVFFGVLAIPSLGGAMPGLADLGLMAVLGITATAGHFLFTSAYREAPASMLAPVNYLHLAWAGGLGFVVFGHLPDWLSASGMALVMFAGVLVALRSRFASRPPVPATAPAPETSP